MESDHKCNLESDHNMRTDALATTSPLMTKALLQFLVDAYAHHTAPTLFPDAPPIGKGIGLAFGLFAMQRMSEYVGVY